MREKTKLPEILGMKPKAALRAWHKYLADQAEPHEGELAKLATFVDLAIKQLDMNLGTDAEHSCRVNLSDRFADYVNARRT